MLPVAGILKIELLQSPAGFAEALAVSRPTACKTCVFKQLKLQN
jgi:hypothetical protein